MKAFVALSTLLIVFLPLTVVADIYRCGTAYYDSTTLKREDCELIRSSKVCGSDGNRYFSPSKHSLPVLNEDCSSSSPRQSSSSPFITIEESSDARLGHAGNGYSKQFSNGENFSEESFRGALNNLFKVFQCASDGFSGDMDTRACSDLVDADSLSGGSH